LPSNWRSATAVRHCDERLSLGTTLQWRNAQFLLIALGARATQVFLLFRSGAVRHAKWLSAKKVFATKIPSNFPAARSKT
jgi:hypothetical protein